MQVLKNGHLSEWKPVASIYWKTIQNKIKNNHHEKVGRAFILSVLGDELFLTCVEQICFWKFLLDMLNLRLMVKNYLNKKGTTNRRFQNNTSGKDWAKNFIKRNNLTNCLSTNIKQTEVCKANFERYLPTLPLNLRRSWKE